MNSYIETAISLVLIFFIFSIIAYVIQELVAVNLKFRGRMLFNSLSKLLDGDEIVRLMEEEKKSLAGEAPRQISEGTLVDELYKHPQIKILSKKAGAKPAFIPAANFAMAVIDIIRKKSGSSPGDAIMLFEKGLTAVAAINPDLEVLLKNLLVAAKCDLNQLQLKIEEWFNSYMDRVTGWYQSHVVMCLRIIAVGIVIFFNLNVIKLAKTIFNDGAMRAGMVAIASDVAGHPDIYTEYYTRNFDEVAKRYDNELADTLLKTTDPAVKKQIQVTYDSIKNVLARQYTANRLNTIDTLTGKLAATHIPIGWNTSSASDFERAGPDGKRIVSLPATLIVLLGWAIAAGCISMGAPFWFDLLIKLVNLRRTGVKPGSEAAKKNNQV